VATSAQYGARPFREQLEFFRQKVSLPTRAWTDVYTRQHDLAFMVAGAAKTDLLADLRAAIERAISDGTTLEQFRADFDDIVQRRGWAYNGGRNWRTRIIYETNLRTSYAAGREAQMADPELRRRRPFGLYRHGGALEPRPHHIEKDGWVVPLDDPWWDEWTPINGWGCGCKKFMLSQRDVDRLGLKVIKPPPSPRVEREIGTRGPSPRTVSVPEGIDPGFEYRPGARAMQILNQVGTSSPPAIAAAYAQAVAPMVQLILQREFDSWIERVLRDRQPRGALATVGLLLPLELTTLRRYGIEPLRTDISVEDRLIVGRKALRHADAGRGLSDREWSNLPTLLANRQAVLFDRVNENLLFVLSTEGDVAKAVIAPDFRSREGSTVNSVRTLFRTSARALRDRTRYELIWGAIDE
jgi:hypothetical protein